MLLISHTAHWQFLGLAFGFLAWILVMSSIGRNDWRLWSVDDESVITSGQAWVGIWRACFFSHSMQVFETCQPISISDSFIPSEILVAQILMVLAMISGLAGNISAGLAMRMAYFSLSKRPNIKLVFLLSGTLYLLTGGMCLVPLVWNMTSVLNNSTINFPPEYHLPPAPVKQRVGSAIIVGILASIMMVISGLLFLCYRYAWETLSSESPQNRDTVSGPWKEMTQAEVPNGGNQGIDNPAFHSEEVS